jgi:hypothetical protein
LFAATFTLATSAVAGTMGAIQPEEKWYLLGGGGYSESRDANIRADSAVWDASDQGYSNTLGSAALFYFGVGRQMTDYLRIDARVERRGDYNYLKYQQEVSDTTSFTSEVRTRQLKLTGSALMLNAWLDLGYLTPKLLWQISDYTIQPFVGGGIGANYLQLHNVHTEVETFDSR